MKKILQVQDNNMSENNRIRYIDLARAIAILSITFSHAVNRSYAISSGSYKEFLKIPFRHILIKGGLYTFSRTGVPLFLMITGALLLSRDYTGDKLKHFLKHNWLTLLITTEIWLVIMFWEKQALPGSDRKSVV